MTEKALIAKLIKNQNRKQTIRHSNSGLVMASVFVILAFSAFAFFKADADQTQKHQEHVLVSARYGSGKTLWIYEEPLAKEPSHG